MKGLSLIQPWATLLASGRKTIETRSMRTSHRGITVIHASKAWPVKRGETLRVGQYTVQRKPVGRRADDDQLWLHWTVRGRANSIRLWMGCAVGYGNLVAVEPSEVARKVALDSGQFELGDYSPGRFGWYFTQLHTLGVPLIMSGQLGVFTVPDKVGELVHAEVTRVLRHPVVGATS